MLLVMLCKIALFQYLDGLPHFSTASDNFRHRLTKEMVEAVLRWILDEAGTAGRCPRRRCL